MIAVFAWTLPFLKKFSYLAVFVLSALSTSTIFLPLPIYAVEFVVTSLGMNPLFVGIIAGLGSTVGEMTGYLAGLGGSYVVKKKKIRSEFVRKMIDFFSKYGFATIMLTAFLPFPFDIIGILAGVSRYDVKKFYLATLIGKTAKNLIIAYSGFFIGMPLVRILRIAEIFG